MSSESEAAARSRSTVGAASRSVPRPASASWQAGTRLFAGPIDAPDRYELTHCWATGGEGTVYRARYSGGLTEPLEFAVKALHRTVGPGVSWPTPEDLQLWEDQVALLQQLNTPHLVRIRAAFVGPPPHPAKRADREADAIAYSVLEWVDGPTLDEVIDQSPASPANFSQRMGYVRDIAEAIATLHSRTLTRGNPTLHRDVKPTNCIVSPGRGVVLVDVSSMRLIAHGGDLEGLHSPAFAAPEVRQSPYEPRRPPADRYSLGAIAAFCLLGETPVADADLVPRLQAAARVAGAPRPQLVAHHIGAMLDPDPERRPTDPVLWADGLIAVARTDERRKPDRGRMRLAATAVAAVAVTGFAGLYLGAPRGDEVSREARSAHGAVPTITRAPDAKSAALQALPPGGTTATPWGTARITRPTSGANVMSCAYIEGTADVPEDVRIVTAMRNADTDDTWHVEHIYSWDDPDSIKQWRGPQWFGSGDSSVGSTYEVAVFAVKRADLVVADAGADDEFDRLAEMGEKLASVMVRRVAGEGPDRNCDPADP
ncbi:putative serine/threonine protein kinase [Kineosphaera limosa NBRC 100340]|uniref:non-specific serine/threonine protein kinase n=1 Tax=Kineosphaera limosa NBRC 100340 TaxID=1184609 RepID=K6WYG4_9MICO|nr:protein kinase [Kineosphaera limosa]GAB97147.1 putative serine/threonine protein kinase [Kineosphaera limosa NBRC 100340]